MQVLNFGSVAEVRTGGVAYLAHIAGFVFGAVSGRFLADRRRLTYPSSTY
jgi:membrane associated rhomboid family serine protease